MQTKRYWARMTLAVLIAFVFAASSAAASTFNSTDDTYIDQQFPSNNNGGISSMAVRCNDGHISNDWELASMAAFDISSIPSGATITSATINLYYFSWSDNNPAGRIHRCYRITSSWDESTVTWTTRPSWSATQTSQISVPGSFGWVSWDVTSDVQDFVDGVETNYGWIIRDTGTWDNPGIPYAHYRTKEYGSLVPYLEVEWEEVCYCCTLQKEAFDNWPLYPHGGDNCNVYVVAQSFTPQEAYKLCDVSVVLQSTSGTATATLYVQDGPGSGASVYTSVSRGGISAASPGDWYTFDVPDINLSASTTYYIRVTGAVLWRNHDGNLYSGGTAYRDGTQISYRDQWFTTDTYEECLCEQVPALSQWGSIFLCLLIVATAALILSKRRRRKPTC